MSPADDPAAPAIPWSRITALHLAAGPVICWVIGIVRLQGNLTFLSIVLGAGLVLGIALALPGLLGARAVWAAATRSGRDPVAEGMAVALGAVTGSAFTYPVFVWAGVVIGAPEFVAHLVLTGVVAMGSAAGLALWVGLAWQEAGRSRASVGM